MARGMLPVRYLFATCSLLAHGQRNETNRKVFETNLNRINKNKIIIIR